MGKGKYIEREYTTYASQLGPAIVTKQGWKLRYYAEKNIFQLYYFPDDYKEKLVLNDKLPKMLNKLKTLLFEECDGNWENGGFPSFVKPRF